MYYLAICMPTAGEVKVETASALWDLHEWMRFHSLTDEEDRAFRFVTCRSTVIHMGRESLIENAIAHGATHILFVDSDMAFVPETVKIMASRNLPIVVANYPRKELPIRWTAVDMDALPIPVTRESTGLVEADYAGLGLALIDLKVFEQMPKPWFLPAFEGGAFVGEDAEFFRNARVCGFSCMVDLDASKGVAHVGDVTYNWRMGK